MSEDEKSVELPVPPSKIKREKQTPPREAKAAAADKAPEGDIFSFLGTLFTGEASEEADDKKNVEPMKSSDEILSELFQVLHATPINLKEKSSSRKKKHKKHKKKSKKKKREDGELGESDSDSDSSSESRPKVKKEREENDEEERKKRKKSEKSREKAAIKSEPGEAERKHKSSSTSRDDKDKKEKEKEEKEKEKQDKQPGKIVIKDLRNSTILSAASRSEKEKSEKSRDHHSKDKNSRKRRHSSSDDKKKSQEKAGLSDFSFSDEDEYIHREYSPIRGRSDHREPSDRDRRRERRTSSRHDDYRGRGRSDRGGRDRFWGGRRRDRSRSRSRVRSSEPSEKIDKKKLLEIARKNAISMLKNGSLPGCHNLAPAEKEKALAKMTSGGKSIEELTEYCKKLSNGENLDLLSGGSSGHEDSDHDGDGNARPFHHPFVVKDRGPIVMNIKNSVPIPPKTAEQTKALLMQFPVSSGQHHRATENEWVPVSPKKPDPPPKEKKTAPIPAKQLSQAFYTIPTEELPPPTPAHQPEPEPTVSIFPEAPTGMSLQSLDVSSIISQRLNAMRKLQENPTDREAQELMQNTQRDMSNWATSKFTPGKFLGSTGANILSAKELQSGFQAWAKRDQLINTAPVAGGMGMHLLQKMGWRPGEALGKEKTGSLQPLLLEMKLDRKGLAANEENPQVMNRKRRIALTKQAMESKHPVSLLGEISSKRKWLAPIYEVVKESGPGHHKNFLFKVTLNGMSYTPTTSSKNKKEAKALAARVCLEQMGILS